MASAATCDVRAGLVGLGHQGSLLAAAMLDRGVRLTVHDRRSETVAEAVSRGAIAAPSIAALARSVDVAMVCVVDDAQVAEVVLGRDGLLDALSAGAVIVIHSTVSPRLIGEIESRAAAREVALVDAPVSGGRPGSPAKLTYLVGGPPEAVRTCLPLFGGRGLDVTLTGGTGSAVRAKLAHQLILCVTHLAADEGRRLALAQGVGLKALAAAVRRGPARSTVSDRLPGETLLEGTAGLLLKDIALCLELAEEEQIDLPGARAALDMLKAKLIAGT